MRLDHLLEVRRLLMICSGGVAQVKLIFSARYEFKSHPARRIFERKSAFMKGN